MKLILQIIVVLQLIFNVYSQLTSTFIKPLVNESCGIRTGGPLVQQLTTPLTDTSGLFWSDSGVKLPYVERFGPAYGRYTPNDGRFNRMAINEGHEAIAIFPVKNGTGLKFVIGLDNRLVLADVTGTGTNLQSKIYNLMIVTNNTNEIFLKGKVDNKGRLWYASTQHHSIFPRGKLYKIDNLQSPQVMEENLYAGAGMAWTQDYKYFYLTDNHIGTIYKYDFDSDNGVISNRRIIFRMTDHKEIGGNPFDLALDDQGFLWIGLNEAGTVIQYDENSRQILWQISIPASDIASVEFGGLDRKTLYVGTRKKFLKKPNLQPAAGAIFSITDTGASGLTDNEIVIPEKYRNLSS